MSSGEANVWQPRTVVEVDGDFQSVSQEFIATAGQTTFTLTDFAYVPESGALRVYVNGEFMPITSGFVEAGESAFSLVVGAALNDVVVAVGQVGYSSGTAEAYAGYAQEWAENPEDDAVSVNAGGDGVTTFSSLHWAAKALASFLSMDVRYLGEKAADPALDNQGNALAEGATYWNTTDDRLKFYTGTVWTAVPITAAEMPFTPYGDLVATNVQDMGEELNDYKVEKTSDVGSALLPAGTTAERDGANGGDVRYNKDLDEYEGWFDHLAAYGSLGGGQLLGNAAEKAIFYNAQTIGEDITIAATRNAMSAGPISINTGFTVTVETGARWVIS